MKNNSSTTFKVPVHLKVALSSMVFLFAALCASHSSSAMPTSPASCIPLGVREAAFIPDRKADAKDVVSKLVAEDYEGVRKTFNEQMKSGLSAEKLKEVWMSVIEHLGQYKSQDEPRSDMVQGVEVVVIRCQMERGQIDVEVDYDMSGQIGGLWIRPAS